MQSFADKIIVAQEIRSSSGAMLNWFKKVFLNHVKRIFSRHPVKSFIAGMNDKDKPIYLFFDEFYNMVGYSKPSQFSQSKFKHLLWFVNWLLRTRCRSMFETVMRAPPGEKLNKKFEENVSYLKSFLKGV